jgi:hypothetical protein
MRWGISQQLLVAGMSTWGGGGGAARNGPQQRAFNARKTTAHAVVLCEVR